MGVATEDVTHPNRDHDGLNRLTFISANSRYSFNKTYRFHLLSRYLNLLQAKLLAGPSDMTASTSSRS